MPTDHGVFDVDRMQRGGSNRSRHALTIPTMKRYRRASQIGTDAGSDGSTPQEIGDRPLGSDCPEYLTHDDVDWPERQGDRANVDEALARAGIFQGLKSSANSALTQQLQAVDFPPGQIVFAEGEPGDRLYIIVSGKVKIGRRSPDGHENLLTLMGPSDMFGELSIFDPGPRTSSATTITDVRPYGVDGPCRAARLDRRPARDRRAAAAGAGPSAAPHQ